MPHTLVVGNVNLETSLKLAAFPLENASSYQLFNLELSVSGVGFSIAQALQTLGAKVRFASVIGPDTPGRFIRSELSNTALSTLLHTGERSGRSLVLSDATGARHVHTDLGGVTDTVYPVERFDAALKDCELAVLTNIEYARPLLARALSAGVPISTDLHAIRGLDNPYDEDFLEAATLLFLSGEYLKDAALTVSELRSRFNPEVIVVGLGAGGALLSERGRKTLHVPAFAAPHLAGTVMASTVGAGDALHAAFCHFWVQGQPPERALRLACAFATQKIRVGQGGAGFVSEAEVRSFAASASAALSSELPLKPSGQ